MTRAQRHTTPPPKDLSEFPARTLTPAGRLWRIHWADRGAWWFCSDLNHRFDLPNPLGTCHLANSPLGSFVEVFTGIGAVAKDEIDARRLSELHVPRRVRLADCTSPLARGFGCTGEIHTIDDYDLTQQWAAAFAAARFDGIRYLVRHDPSQRQVGVALFGDPAAPKGWPEPKTEAIPSELVTQAARRFGIHVLPTP